MDQNKINLELSINEAKILAKIIQSHTPESANELIALMLYSRIIKLLEKHE